MTESLLDKFNKNIKGGIKLTQEDIKTLEAISVDDINDIDRVGFVEVVQEISKTLLGYLVGKPAQVVEPVAENAVTVLSDFEKQLENELNSVDTGQNAIEYARRAIIRSRLRKRPKNAAEFGANQIEYISSSTETAIEPFLDVIEQPLVGAGTAIGNYAATNTTIAAKKMIQGIGNTTIEALETVKNIPVKISNYAEKTYNSISSINSYLGKFWSFVDSMSDFFYITCALIILGKFDFLLKNIYILIIVAILIVYTINR